MAYAATEVSGGRPASWAIAAGAPAGLLLFLLLVLFSPLLALVAGVLVWGAVAWFVWQRASDVVLRLVGGAPPDLAQQGPARLSNLVASVATAAGVPVPALRVVDDVAPNALATGRTPRAATLVATSGLVDSLDVLQLEAVIAHQLALIRAGATHGRDVATVVLGVPGRWVRPLARAHVRAVSDGHGDALVLDAAAVALTRYPPAMLAALAAGAAAAPVRADPVLGPLWWVPAERAGIDLRLDHLRELA